MPLWIVKKVAVKFLKEQNEQRLDETTVLRGEDMPNLNQVIIFTKRLAVTMYSSIHPKLIILSCLSGHYHPNQLDAGCQYSTSWCPPTASPKSNEPHPNPPGTNSCHIDDTNPYKDFS